MKTSKMRKRLKKKNNKNPKSKRSLTSIGRIVSTNPKNGDKKIYIGEIKNGLPHGFGIDDYVDEGYKIEGEFRNGSANGQSIITWSDSHKYEGQVMNGGLHGHGTYTHTDGTIHVGEWSNDNPFKLKVYENGKLRGKHYWLRNGGSSSIDDKFLTMDEFKIKFPKNKSLNN